MDSPLTQGIQMFESGRYQLAIDQFLETGIDPSGNPLVAYYLGLCYARLDQYEDALLYLEQVVTSSENILHIYQCRMILGYIYTITGRYELARFEFNELVIAGYESPQSFAAMGYISYIKNNRRESIDYFERALRIDPDNPNAKNSLGYTLAELDQDLDRALQLCKSAVKARPKNAAYLDSLGWAFYKKGLLKDAKTFLRRALDLSKNNRTIASHFKTVLDAEKKE